MSNTEWKKVKLGDIGKLTMGSTPSTKVAEYYGGDRLWITPSDIVKGNKYVSETERKLTDLGWSEARHIPANSILITCIASIGKNCIATEEVSCNQQIIALTPSEDYDVHYLYYAICSIENQLHSIAGKATVEIVNKTKLSSVEIDVPSLEEQRRIASLLSRFDELIELKKSQKQQVTNMKQQLMSQLLTNGGQSSWVTVKLGDIARVKSGGTPKTSIKEYYSGNICFLSINDMTKQGKYTTETEKHITSEAISSCSAWVVPEDSLMYSMCASVGFASINKVKMATNQAIAALTDIKCNTEYLYYWLTMFKDNGLESLITASTQRNINASIVKNIEVKIPPTIEEQQKIASVLSTFDSLLEQIESEKLNISSQKQAIMDKIFG